MGRGEQQCAVVIDVLVLVSDPSSLISKAQAAPASTAESQYSHDTVL
jgi:hypothetical protein